MQGFKAKQRVPEHLNSYGVATLPSCFLVIPALFSYSTYLGPRDVPGSFSHQKRVEGRLLLFLRSVQTSRFLAQAKMHLAREKRIIKAPNFNFLVFSEKIHVAIKIISKATA